MIFGADNEGFHQLLHKINNTRKLIFLEGDFNFNLLKYGVHVGTTNFLDFLNSSYFLPQITVPTRLTSNSTTLIDNIFLNTQEFETISGNILSSISDHLPQFVLIKKLFQKHCF